MSTWFLSMVFFGIVNCMIGEVLAERAGRTRLQAWCRRTYLVLALGGVAGAFAAWLVD